MKTPARSPEPPVRTPEAPLHPQERQIEPKILRPTGLDHDRLDADAVRAVQRLQSRGFEAYLVGGCVRDLLLGREPKDYDIATAARPAQVKRSFPRNCRIIGRRFKLAHLHFNQNRKILEVATFRTSPAADGEGEEDLLITRDNEFGTAEEDALRRDFTVNALFLDPIKDRILDYVGGLADVEHRVLRTIGEPIVRFREDPVRIIRAAKFAGRLDFALEPPTFEAMAEVAPDLSRSAPPRMLEEILRLLRGGHSLDSFQILRDIGALKVVLPIVAEFLQEAPEQDRVRFWRTLEALDARLLGGNDVPNPVLLGVLFAAPVRTAALRENRRSWTTVAEQLIGPFAAELRLPRRDAGCLKRICGVQQRFTARGPKRFKTGSFLRDPYFREALELFDLVCKATGDGMEDLRRWRQLYAQVGGPRGDAEPEAEADERAEGAPRGRRRRGRRSRGRAGERDGARPEPRRPEEADQADERPPAEPAGRQPGKKKRRSRRGRKAAPAAAGEQDGQRAERQTEKGKKPEAAKAAARKGPKKAPKKARKKAANKRTRGRGTPREQVVETIEPETYDVSAFDVELDPKRVPTFGALVEGHDAKKRKKQVPKAPPGEGDDDYKPPPPPSHDPQTPPAPRDDEFGDW